MKNFDELLKKYADFIVRVGVNPQPGQTMIIRCPLEAAPLARLCVRSGFEAGARDVQVDWSDNAISRTRMELGSEEALTDSKPYQLRRYLDYAESEGSVCVLHLIADDPEVYAGLDGAKISRVNAANRKFMAPWREYTMNDRVQWSIAAMPSAPWAKKMFPELDTDAAIEKLWQLWLVRGPRAKKAAPEAAAPEETDFQEYQPEKKMPSLLDHFARKAEPDTTGEVTLDPEDEDDGREEE